MRIKAIEDRLLSDGFDGFLITKLPNVRYMTGYTGSNGIALLYKGKRLFLLISAKNTV
jgi:Xaa-Pro aminopeptidase